MTREVDGCPNVCQLDELVEVILGHGLQLFVRQVTTTRILQDLDRCGLSLATKLQSLGEHVTDFRRSTREILLLGDFLSFCRRLHLGRLLLFGRLHLGRFLLFGRLLFDHLVRGNSFLSRLLVSSELRLEAGELFVRGRLEECLIRVGEHTVGRCDQGFDFCLVSRHCPCLLGRRL